MKLFVKKITPSFLINWYHFLLSFLGAVLYGFSSEGMIVIGVTGTKGKSTVVEFCHKIFQEAGFKVASLSSIRFKINEKEWPNKSKMTMPGRFTIQRFLKQAKDNGCKYAIIEVTSEGILQHRQRFIDFNTAVFTNLSLEHIERHGSFENYRSAKGKLFEVAKKTHILNLDDENSNYFLQFPAEKKCGFTTKESVIYNQQLTVIEARKIVSGDKGIEFSVSNIKFKLSLLGEFNVYNALAAICVGLSQGIKLEVSKKALEEIEGVPGRMEMVIKEPFKVIIDYAHTPDALEKVYQTVEKLKSKISNPNPKTICVLGSCGGGRDKWKRPVLGEIAAKYCNEIIVTNEDPYDEDPMEIINQVAAGSGERAKKILDRKEAIKEALKLAVLGDVVIITGKGCEPWMCVVGGKKIAWDDRKIAREEFRKLKEKI